MQNWILTSVQSFFSATEEIILKNNALFYIELGDSTGSRRLIKITKENDLEIQSMVNEKIGEFSYRNFIIMQKDIDLDISKSIYEQAICNEYIIDGRGGRETNCEIECIYLNTLLKKPNKATNSLYSKIITGLKLNSNFKLGFSDASAMSRRALYDIRVVNKIKKFDLNNRLSIIDIRND